MKKSILTGILALAAGASGLMAQGRRPRPAAAVPKQPDAEIASRIDRDSGDVPAQQQNNMDGVIKAADDLMTKFADTEFKELALYMEAEAYEQKGDPAKAQVYAEQALALNPKSYQADIMLARIDRQADPRERSGPRRETGQGGEVCQRTRSTNVKDAPKPNPQITDEQWDEFKKGIAARAHNAIGLASLTRKKYDAGGRRIQAGGRRAIRSPPSWCAKLRPCNPPARTTKPSRFAIRFWPIRTASRRSNRWPRRSRPRRGQEVALPHSCARSPPNSS